MRAPHKPGGQGGPAGDGATALLADPHHTRADLRLLNRAVKEEWDVSTPVRRAAIARLAKIVRKETVTVMTKAGEAELDGPADTNAIGAASVLERMVRANQGDQHHVEKIAAGHKAPQSPNEVRILILDGRGNEREVPGIREFYDATVIPSAPALPVPARDAAGPGEVQGGEGRAKRR